MGYQFNYSCVNCQNVIILDSDAVGSTMYCPKCGNAFVVTPPQAPAGQPAPGMQQGVPMAPYPAQQPYGGFAPVPQPADPGKPALILGIVSLVFGGLIGLICSIIGLSFAKKSPKKTGYVLNMIGLVWSLIVFALAIAFLNSGEQREIARRANCVSKLKQIGLGVFLYADANKDNTPSGMGKDSLELLIKGGYFDFDFASSFDNVTDKERKLYLQCPSDENLPSYAYVGEGLVIGRDYPGLPIVVEYPTNHDSLFADRVVNVCFLGGHVSAIPIPEDCKTISQVVEYVLQQEGVTCEYRNDYYCRCGRCKVLENAKQY